MSITKASKIGGIVCLVCIVILVACVVQLVRSIGGMEEFAQRRFDSILLAREIRETSSGLTANARAYVSTGDEAYEKAYWDLVKIRSGEIPRPAEAQVAPGKKTPVNDLLKEAGFTEEELRLLEESVKISNDLVLIEDKAMNAVKGLFQDASGGYTVRKEPDRALAQRLMFGKEYDAAVERIMVPSFKFDRLVTERISAQYAGILNTLDYAVIALCAAVAVMSLLVLSGVYMLVRRIMLPVAASAAYAQRIAEGNLDATPPAFSFSEGNEIGAMLEALRRMVANLKERIGLAENKSREAEEHGKKAERALADALDAKNTAEAGRAAMALAAENVEQVVSRLSTAAEELSAQVESSAQSMHIQQRRVDDSVTAMGQMNATVLEVASRAGMAAEKSNKARETAMQGDAITRQSVASIVVVQKDTQELKENMEALGGRAQSIGAVMTVISDIADQTNLLALNAAIEAARAGDAGRGFAVVADEVRKLAEKTMTATKEVGEAIKGIQTGTRQSVTTVERTTGNLDAATEQVRRSGEALREIVDEITDAAAQVASIAAASEEQSAASEEITRSLEEIHTMAESTTAAMQQAGFAVSDLAGQSRELQELTESLRKQ